MTRTSCCMCAPWPHSGVLLVLPEATDQNPFLRCLFPEGHHHVNKLINSSVCIKPPPHRPWVCPGQCSSSCPARLMTQHARPRPVATGLLSPLWLYCSRLCRPVCPAGEQMKQLSGGRCRVRSSRDLPRRPGQPPRRQIPAPAPRHTFPLVPPTSLLDGKPSPDHRRRDAPCPHSAGVLAPTGSEMAKAMGCNTIAAYIFWGISHHETSEGVFDFTSPSRDIARFVKIAQDEGMWVLLRPGGPLDVCCRVGPRRHPPVWKPTSRGAVPGPALHGGRQAVHRADGRGGQAVDGERRGPDRARPDRERGPAAPE